MKRIFIVSRRGFHWKNTRGGINQQSALINSVNTASNYLPLFVFIIDIIKLYEKYFNESINICSQQTKTHT